MALMFNVLEGVEFSNNDQGNLKVICRKLSEEPLGWLDFIAYSAEKPEDRIPVKVRMVQQQHAGLTFVADSPVLSLEGRITPEDRGSNHFHIKLIVTNRGPRGAYSLSVRLTTRCENMPRFMIPGIFYKHNRPPECSKKYPGFVMDGNSGGDAFLSNYWAFRSDRCAEPAVFGWNDHYSLCLATSPVFEKGQSGVFIRGEDQKMEIGLHYPYSEEPVKYSFCYDTGTAPEYTFFFLERQEDFDLNFEFSFGRRDLHFYSYVLRTIYERDHHNRNTHPWMNADTASELASIGLFKWHYDHAEKVLWETASFDKYYTKKPDGYAERLSMHTGWVSGAPTACALLWWGRISDNNNYIEAGISVLDKVSSGTAPCGTFYPAWVHGKGWTGGWNPQNDWLQARTSAEATLFLIRAIRNELKYGHVHQKWLDAVKSSLDFAESIQRQDGHFGSYYNMNSGEVMEWEGAGGLLWIAALIAGAFVLEDQRYLDAAVRAGYAYASYIEDEFIYGAPEDVHLTPTSEDGYNALISYLLLGESTHHEEWYNLAAKAADWLLTFRFSYNTRLPQFCILSEYDLHSKGGDIASPCNQHLHFYGLVCHPELMRLGKYLNDDYYIQRSTEHLEFCHQFIARDEGDFGARKGMVPEQFYHTDWWQPKGHLLALSHAWCAGLLIYANCWEKENLGESSIRLHQAAAKKESGKDEESSRQSRTTEEMPPSERETLFDL